MEFWFELLSVTEIGLLCSKPLKYKLHTNASDLCFIIKNLICFMNEIIHNPSGVGHTLYYTQLFRV